MKSDRRLSGHEQVIETACPLDCPDSCSLTVRVNHGQVLSLEGSHRQPATAGVICAKVRRFPERLYGEARLRSPSLRSGPKGSSQFARASWEEALHAIASAIRLVTKTWGGEAILPFSYGGSNGLLSQDTRFAAGAGPPRPRNAGPGPAGLWTHTGPVRRCFSGHARSQGQPVPGGPRDGERRRPLPLPGGSSAGPSPDADLAGL